jgi:histidyl-tRNA synthetase
LVTVFGEELNSVSTEFAVELRKSGTKAILYPEVVKLTKQLKFANRIGITIAIVIGPDEKANGNITIKDLRDGTQQIVSRTDGITVINRLLASATLV